jgi:hypothetical protein
LQLDCFIELHTLVINTPFAFFLYIIFAMHNYHSSIAGYSKDVIQSSCIKGSNCCRNIIFIIKDFTRQFRERKREVLYGAYLVSLWLFANGI